MAIAANVARSIILLRGTTRGRSRPNPRRRYHCLGEVMPVRLGVLLAGLTTLALINPVAAGADPRSVRAASAHASGLPALLIILVVLALIVIGAFVVIRAVVRKGRDAL